jgi:flagellin
LIAEIGRVGSSTEFNGARILDGSLQDLFFQVGANQGQTIAVAVSTPAPAAGRAGQRGDELRQTAING